MVKKIYFSSKRVRSRNEIISGEEADIKVGNALPMGNMPEGTVIHNIEMQPGKGGQIARSAGVSAQILGKEEKICNCKTWHLVKNYYHVELQLV